MAGPGAGLGAGALRPPRRRVVPRRTRRLKPRGRALLLGAALVLPALALALPAPDLAGARGLPADDPLLDRQDHLTESSLPDAWPTSTGEGVVIAVLDSGIDQTHPDLADRVLPGADVVTAPAASDPLGTGTHAAGVAAADTDNGVGIAGAAPDARLLSVRVLDRSGRVGTDQLVTGLATAADAGAGVIALTLGGDPQNLARAGDPEVRAAIDAATAAGSVVVVGDGGADLATGLDVVVVGDGRRAPTGPGVLTAAGGDVVSTTPSGPTATWPAGTDGYDVRRGLSPATALVAGAAALLVAQGLTPEEVADLLVGTARNPTGDALLGAGRLDAAAAVEQAGTVGAGGRVLPRTDEDGGGLPPALVGGVAVGAAVLAVGATVALAGRRTRPR